MSGRQRVRALRRAELGALLAGWIAGCAAYVQAPAPAEEPSAVVSQALSTPPDIAPPAEEGDRARPLLRTHVADARSTAEFQPFSCDVPVHDWANAYARMLQLADDTDFLELSVVESSGDGAVTPDQLGVWARAGSECGGAQDHLACVRALAEAKAELRQQYTCNGKACSKPSRLFGVLTRGDRVQKLRTPTDFRALLGTIDTPVEAWLMLMLEADQPYFTCNDPTRARHRRVSGHYQLVALNIARYFESDTPRTVQREFSYRVEPSGEVKRTQAEVVSVAKGCVVAGAAAAEAQLTRMVRD